MHATSIALAIIGALTISTVAVPVASPEAAPVSDRLYWKSTKKPVWCYDGNIQGHYICKSR